MSNLRKKITKVEIDNKEYIMCFDMRSIDVFKEISGEGFIIASSKIGQFDDRVILAFLGASLRPDDDEENPIGIKIYDMDIMHLLLSYSGLVIKTVLDAMPRGNGVNSKKK